MASDGFMKPCVDCGDGDPYPTDCIACGSEYCDRCKGNAHPLLCVVCTGEKKMREALDNSDDLVEFILENGTTAEKNTIETINEVVGAIIDRKRKANALALAAAKSKPKRQKTENE